MSTKKTAIRGQLAVSREVYWETPRRRRPLSPLQETQVAQTGVPMDGSPAED